MKPTVSGIYQLDRPPGPHSAQEKAVDASESKYANPRDYADPIQSAYIRTGVNKMGSSSNGVKLSSNILLYQCFKVLIMDLHWSSLMDRGFFFS
jgi:hypothetical protein